MKYFLSIILILNLFSLQFAWAQNPKFLSEGQIIFERRVNIYPVFESLLTENKNIPQEGVPKMISDYKANNAQFSIRTFNLKFNNNSSLYQASEDKEINPVSFLNQAAFKNMVYSNLGTKQSITEKAFFDHPVFIQDTLRKIKWRLTGETRIIANYLCRRANALIMDSVYVVAYYTDQIITKSGPESFTGLPGMILGVAIPEEHVTWFATKVSTGLEAPINYVLPAMKDKPLTQKEYRNIVIKFLDAHSANTRWFLNFLCY